MATLASWTTGTLPTTIGSGVTAVTNGGPVSGVDAIQYDQVAATACTSQLTFTAATAVGIRSYMRLPAAWAASSQRILGGRFDGSTLSAALNLAGSGSAGQVRLINTGGSTSVASSSTGTVANTTWYRFELLINHSANQARLGIFALGSDTPLYDSGWMTDSFQASTARADFGPNLTTPTLGSMRAADLEVVDSAASWVGRAAWDNNPPVVSPVAAQTVAAGAAVTIDISATDDGSIASYASSIVSAKSTASPTLTGASTATITFTAPAAGNLVTGQTVVTDNLGATTTIEWEVRVPTSTTPARHLAINGSSVGTWSIQGGSGTDGAALNDESDSTYLQSPDLAGTETSKRVRIVPLTTRTGYVFTERLALSAAGTPTVKFRVYEGAAMKQEFTVTGLTTSPQDYTFTLTASVSDTGNLWGELAGVA